MARVAIVTGGTRGIGRAVSVSLNEAGCKVVANYARDEGKAESFASETGIAARKWDVSDFNACVTAVNAAAEEFGPVDILVNNAGITRDGTMRKMSRENWDQVLDTNLGGCFNMCKAVWDGMLARLGQVLARARAAPVTRRS